MIPLSEATLGQLPAAVRRPLYDRRALRTGIVHIGVGNFFRVHAALAVERCLEEPGNEAWGICGVGIVPGEAGRAKAAAYRRQDGLYTVTTFARDGSSSVAVVGAMIDYLHGPDDPAAVVGRLASPDTHIVSLTITEGGYDLDRVLAERGGAGTPVTAFDYILAGLAGRRAAGLPPFTVMSCDNLSANGDTTRRIVLALAERADPALAEWIAARGAFPNSMVDRIAPKVGEDDRRALDAASGIADALPAVCETYTNWVMQDRFCDGRPPFERAGVSLREDVAAFEAVKQRLSNAAHMLMCYPSVLLGYRLINESMQDARIEALLRAFWTRDAFALVTPPPGLSVERFTDEVIERFANLGINDQVLRVCGDGASKIRVFHGKTLTQLVERGGSFEREAFLLACFARYLGGVDDTGARFPVVEPAIGEADWALLRSGDPAAVLRIGAFAPLGLAESEPLRQAVAAYARALEDRGIDAVLSEVVA